MLLKRINYFFMGLLAGCAPVTVLAQSHGEQDVAAVLNKVQTAPQKLSYSGTFVYQQASQIRTSRVTHIVDANGELEKLEILDGNPREYIRRNDEVSCYLPDSKTIQVEKHVTQEVFPSVLTGNTALLHDSYHIHKADMGRIAGLECQLISFDAKDPFRFGYRLCVEKNSNLILGAQTLNNRNEIIEQISFAQISIGAIDKNLLKPNVGSVVDWQIENLTVPSQKPSGWRVAALPAGFKKINEINRVIPFAASAAKTSAPAAVNQKEQQVVQMIFSDGLASISVFIEPYSGSRTEGILQQGAMTIMGKHQGDFWLTVVGEVPFVAIKQVINSIEFKPK